MCGAAMGEPAEDPSEATAPSAGPEAAGQDCPQELELVEQSPPLEEEPPQENCVAACTGLANDSGVEIAGGEYASSGAPDQLSCASSLISCGSVCDDSFDMLSCKHDRLDDFKAGVSTAGDGTSEGGSESSSVTGGTSGPPRRNTINAGKRRVAVNDVRPNTRPRPIPAPRGPNLATRERARSRDKANSTEKPPPPGPKPNIIPRSRLRNAPDVLALICRESPSLKVKATKTSAARCRTPGTPPDEPRSLRLVTPLTPVTPPLSRTRTAAETKAAFDKYATLPRRKRETSPPDVTPVKKDYARSASVSREVNRGTATLRRTNAMESPPLRSLPPYPKHKLYPKTRIYMETYAQTALSGSDVQKALEGVGIKEIRTDLVLVQKSTKGIQVDYRNIEVERLEQKIKSLQEANSKLQGRCDAQSEKLTVLESRLEAERADKMAAQVELQQNTERVLQLVGRTEGGGEGDGLVLLEEQLKSSAGVVARQQDEIRRLHDICRDLQKEVDNGCRSIRSLESLLRCQENESSELLDFLACEKSALQEALREAELAAREVAPRRAECRALLRLAETRRQQLLAERARRAQRQACACAPTHVALKPALTNLLAAMITRYRIPPEDLEDVIFHNEAFSRSGSSEAYSPLSPPPRAPHPQHNNNNNNTHNRLSDDEISADLLDSETEPCLMMESVLEDVAVPDTYSHNLVSSGLSVMSCPTQLNKPNKLQPLISKEDSCSSLQNITTNFSADDYSPIVDDKFANDMANYYTQNGIDSVDAFYLENDISLQNLSQAILQRQQSEAECNSLSNVDYIEGVSGDGQELDTDMGKGGCLVEQVIEVDNLVNKLLKVFRIIQETEDAGQQVKTVKETPSETQPDSEVQINQISESVKEMKINGEHAEDIEVIHQNGLPYNSLIQCVSPSCVSGSGEWCGRQCGGTPSPAHLQNLPDCNTSTPQPIDSAA